MKQMVFGFLIMIQVLSFAAVLYISILMIDTENKYERLESQVVEAQTMAEESRKASETFQDIVVNGRWQ